MRTRFIWSAAAAVAALLALGACTKHQIIPRPDYPNGGQQQPSQPSQPSQETKLKEHSDWSVLYKGRDWFFGSDDSQERVEIFQFTYTGSHFFIFRTISPDDLASLYEGDLMAFFDDQVNFLVQNSAVTPFYDDMNSVFDASTDKVAFDLLFHGTWLGYMIEVDASGKATGGYAKASIRVQEEEASKEFNRWLGTYHVGDKYVGYDIEITSAEANYFYYVDGWETGPAASEQMNMERDWFYARLRNDGEMSFYIQYLMSYEDENLGAWADEMFIGVYLDSSGEVADNYEGWEIAYTAFNGDGEQIIAPVRIEFDNGFKADYKKMQYAYFWYDPKDTSRSNLLWAPYNTACPNFPLLLEKTGDYTKASAGTPVVRKVTKASLLRSQPKRHAESSALRSRK